LLGKINDLKTEISIAKVIDDEEQNTNIVGFGSKVTLQIHRNGEPFINTFLFSDSDESTDLISITANSPAGSAIFGKKEGTTSSYTVNDNEFTVKILKIEY